jgi:hypothetical protein
MVFGVFGIPGTEGIDLGCSGIFCILGIFEIVLSVVCPGIL